MERYKILSGKVVIGLAEKVNIRYDRGKKNVIAKIDTGATKSSISKTLVVFAISAGILMDFHQELLGRSIDADHWISRVIAPVATLAIFLTLGYVIKNIKRLEC